MYFDEKFLKSLPEDTPSAIVAICNEYFKILSRLTKQESVNLLIAEAYALVAIYCEVTRLNIIPPEIVGDYTLDTKKAAEFFGQLQVSANKKVTQNSFQQYKNHFRMNFDKVFHYEFSEGDLERIQQLVNELRGLIFATNNLEEEHKQRLLNKLEKFQSELHKRVSNLDRFWGFLIEASITIGLMGENVKPMVDRIKELRDIIWPVQTRAYELPSNLPFKLLSQSEENKS
jgi:hypothetical protein